MSDRDSAPTQAALPPGVTNAHVRVVNLVMLASIIVEWLLCYAVGGVDLARVMVGLSTVTYVLILSLAPGANRWLGPGVPFERKRAWFVGVVAYGGASLALIVWTLVPLSG